MSLRLSSSDEKVRSLNVRVHVLVAVQVLQAVQLLRETITRLHT